MQVDSGLNPMSTPTSKKPGRILHVLEAFIGGTARHLVDLLTGLPDWEQAAVVSMREPRLASRIQRLRDAGIRVDVAPMRRAPAPGEDWRALVYLIRLMREQRPDIVHCHSAKAGILGRAAAAAAGVPIRIYSPHALPFHPFIPVSQRLFYWTLEWLAARFTTAMVAVSPSEGRAIEAARLAPPARVFVVPNGVRLPVKTLDRLEARRALGIPLDRPVALCVALLRSQKAPLDWVTMAADVRRSRPDAFFAWVGDGDMERGFLAAAERVLAPGSFRYLGYRADASQAYAAADIFTLASLWEGCPYVLLDAMARGIPCAVTSVAGSQDIIHHGDNGLLSPPGRPSDLANSVLRLLNDVGFAAGIGRRGCETIETEYSLEQCLAGHRRMYSELLSAHPRK